MQPSLSRRTCRGPRGRGRKRRKIAQGSEYSMAGITPPLAAVSSQATWQPAQRAVYIVPCHEIYHFALYHGFISNMACNSLLLWCIWVTGLSLPVVAARGSMQTTCTEEKRSDPLSQPQLEDNVTNPSYWGICQYLGKQCDLGPARWWCGTCSPGGAV